MNDVSSTAHALSADAALNRPTWSGKALTCLLAHQQADAGFTSPPEQLAPAPSPYTHPSHAAVFALTALGEHHQGQAQRRP
ncbi:hypothetical protein ABZ923_31280 [Streptomyces sp. NPDC046881]|uniref:hypothetical protein n=1 Tax=Streptomyces sp. NPDC046881 TaxID=3155374 RepID=UPI00340EE243